MDLVSELKRRNVFRMAALYLVAIWLLMQIAEVVLTLASLPEWVGQVILGLFILGFPIALVLSWFFELTPEGIVFENDGEPGASFAHVTGRRLDFIIISILCAAVMLFAFDKWWPQGPIAQSIVVLPFENTSADPGQEYFSDGVTEELQNLLAKIPELRVISRSSSFAFKGQNLELREIAKRLGVTHILEGSVRKSANQVRITAQLVDTRTDSHLWSETWDRTFDDVFFIQDEIAAAVVEQLKVKLLGDPPVVPQTDPQAYALFLQARYLNRRGSIDSMRNAINLYEQAVAVDPDYSWAWAGLASVYANLAHLNAVPTDEAIDRGRDAIQKALAADPRNAFAWAMLGWLTRVHDRDLRASAAHYEKALALDPEGGASLNGAAVLLWDLGRSEEAIRVLSYLTSRDPLNTVRRGNLGEIYLGLGRIDDARAAFDRVLMLSPDDVNIRAQQGRLYYLEGKYEEYLQTADWLVARTGNKTLRLFAEALVYPRLGREREGAAALAILEHEQTEEMAYNIAVVHANHGRPELAFYWLGRAYEADGGRVIADAKDDVLFLALHDDPRWQQLLGSVGLSDEQLADIEFEVTLPD